ncbi:Prospore formation at selected spindle poles protein 1 [Nakaseomyces bracarensis]|uniref:Prospore formation at selected spindle poles protein 1 n=1 Tax=Nakaseomyces bracarensis TaxID=273131 RepID=A0ABR4NRN6_9SACH
MDAQMSEKSPKISKPLLDSFIGGCENGQDRKFFNLSQDCSRPFQILRKDFPFQQFDVDQMQCNVETRSSFLNKYGDCPDINTDNQLIDENVLEHFVKQPQEKSNIQSPCCKFLTLNDKIPMLSLLNNNNIKSNKNPKISPGMSRYSSSNISQIFFENSILFNPREEKNMSAKDKVDNWIENNIVTSHGNNYAGAEISLDWEENEFDYPETELFPKETNKVIDYQDIIYLQCRKIDSLVRKAYSNERKRYHEDTFDVSTLSSR